MADSLVVQAPAKINLYLDVARALRPDGYHELRTIFQAVELCDTVEIELTEGGITVECDTPGVPTDASNLAARAAAALLGVAHRSCGVRLRLRKAIPPMGGLGGGSSDAAAVLVGLNRLLGAPIGDHGLIQLAVRLGADVAFFIHGGTQVGEGIGEKLRQSRLDVRPWVVILKGAEATSTAEVYAQFDRTGREASDSLEHALERLSAGDYQALWNSLADPAIALAPGIGRSVEALRDEGALGATVSGSGACAFGLFPTRAAAERAAVSLATAFEFTSVCAFREDGVRVIG